MNNEEIEKRWNRVKSMNLSPTSINTLAGCKRRFWYKYIEKLPEKPSIHLTKGIAVHHALEKIFETKIHASMDLRKTFVEKGERLFNEKWKISHLGLTPMEAKTHRDDGLVMIQSFIGRLVDNIEMLILNGKAKDVYHAMNLLKPKFKEIKYTDKTLGVAGAIDQISTDFDGRTVLVDLKTSSKFKNNISEEYERQLAIYAYLYKQEKRETPYWVCINYLRYGESFYIRVTNSFIEWAKDEIQRARSFLLLNKDKAGYYKRESALCPYCSFKEVCARE